MELNEFLKQCNDDDVLSFRNGLFKVGRIKANLKTFFLTQVPDVLYEFLKNVNIDIKPMREAIYHSRQINPSLVQSNDLWFQEGVDVEILRLGASNWQKGKMKIKVILEFEPDEPEQPKSPLDDIRETINQS